MNPAKFSIKNSLLVNTISAFLVVAGIIGIINLKREAFPNISFDTVLITTVYPGSTPREIEKLITIPIEKEIKQVEDIKEMFSASAEGISVITIKIEEEVKNKDRVINEIQRAVDRTEDLPDDLEEQPTVRELKTKNRPVISVSLSGDLTEEKLQEYAKGLEKRILDLSDVAKVARRGWREKQIWVEVKPETMASKHISLSEVIDALRKQNISIPGGTFYNDRQEFIIRTTGEFETVEEVREVVVRANPSGNWVRVKDIANAHYDFEEEKTINKTNGTRAINLVVIKKESGDAIRLVEEVEKTVIEFKRGADDKLEISLINDLSYYIKRRLKVLITNGWIGMLLVIVSLFTFLSLRVAIAACIGIPIALLTAFAIMGWMGISINLLSMFGMIMVIGMVVDEDIVISENVHRHLQLGQSHKEAIITGVAEVGRAVIATVATTIVAFIPLFVMSGIMGKFIRNIPMVVTITLIASLLEALVILPSHIAELTRKIHRNHILKKKKFKERKFFIHLLDRYTNALKKTIRHRYVFTGIVVVVLILSLLNAFFRMDFSLFPQRGIEKIFIRVEGELGDRLVQMDKKIAPIEKIVAELPANEVKSFVTQLGITQDNPDDPFTRRGSHYAQIAIDLTAESKRDRTSDEIVKSIRPIIEKIPHLHRVSIDSAKPGPPIGKAVQVRIRGDNFDTLILLAQKYVDALSKIKGATDIKDDYERGKSEIRVNVDTEAASQASLTTRDIARTIREAFEGFIATTIKTSDEEIDVVVKFPLEYRERQRAIENLLIPNSFGNLIPLNRVAKLERSEGVQVIKHFDGLRTINVTANVDEKVTTALRVNGKLAKDFKDILLPYPGYTIHYGGEQEDTQESLQSLVRAFYIALGLILIILITVFRSLVQPLIILFTIPFSAIGVIFAFETHGLPLSFFALLGVVGLTGVVANSGIIMIDFINRARGQGVERAESIIQGAKLRFRAIILTSLTTALGVLPAAYGIGGLDPFVQPMALALNYGLIFGAFLSLFFVPCLVAITDDIHQFYIKIIGNNKNSQ